ncbi:MAG TPA: lysophospholipid acyltransferase family protein, partial [Balneolaceae bacterium]|nr:lysophospholipid acyltransferase family protein [Balneolaceae bacterium]
MRTFFSIIVWIYWAVCIITFFVIITILYVLTFPFDKYNRIPNICLKGLAWVMMKAIPGWTFEIKGADFEKLSEPTIVVANHQSFLDIPLPYLLPWRMKWVAKKGLFKIPIFGWMIYMTGHLGIDRKSMRSAKALDKLVEPIKAGIPAMIFPEGTRSSSGELKPFKSGAFWLAQKYNFNILPIVLNGGGEAMPAGTWKVA